MTELTTCSAAPVAPPLRWAGGKRWLLPTLRDLLEPLDISRYHEPFIGGGAVFLGLPAASASFLSDSNPELVETYQTIKVSPVAVAERAASFGNDEATYYRVRASAPRSSVGRAARFVYLNHTSFNGIYRVNLAGVYNVPFGRRKWTKIPTAEHLLAVASRLATANISACDFEQCLDNVEADDLVFLDPPYTVAHNHNGFIKYNQKLFSFEDQIRLSRMIDEIKQRGAHYVLTNAAHPSIAELFEKGDRRIETRRRNSVGGTNAIRGDATEYLFTNLEERR